MLTLSGISRRFGGERRLLGGRPVEALSRVSLDLAAGECVGLVGESGSGKSTLARIAVGIDRPTAGVVRFRGTDIATMDAARRRRFRRAVQYVFQDPLAALDPRWTILAQVAEPLAIHGIGQRGGERRDIARAALRSVGLDGSLEGKLPGELSGGQRQRAVLARALVAEPDVLVLDEPIASLDVSVQAQVVALLERLRSASSRALLFISHDLGIVRTLSDRVIVLYRGHVVEEGPAEFLFDAPAHPYTEALVASVLPLEPGAARLPHAADAERPSPATGCAFEPRCPHRRGICREARPAPRTIAPRRVVACHLAGTGA